jgi:hypothetical protein
MPFDLSTGGCNPPAGTTGGFRTGETWEAAFAGFVSGRETTAEVDSGLRMELTEGIALIIWIKDKLAPQFGHRATFGGNGRPQSSHLGRSDFSIGILARFPGRRREEKNSTLLSRRNLWATSKIPFPGDAMPILFKNRQ